MNQLFRNIIISLSFTLSIFIGLAQDYELYYTVDEMPDASIFLPAPPSFESTAFADDFLQWQWGKTIRPTARGKMASRDSEYGINCMADIFGKVLGIHISADSTPAIWKLMYRAGATGRLSVTKAKEKYMRTRPFTKMNEHTFGEYDDEESLRHNGSYPSGHTAFGWSTALALAEMAPEYQDTILRRGFQYGESRVIVGAHWQSDVDAARLAVSSALARMHSSEEFAQDLADARKEFVKIKGLGKKAKCIQFPQTDRIIGEPFDTASQRYYCDVALYWHFQGKRNSSSISSNTDPSLMSFFSPSIGMRISFEETPRIAKLMSEFKAILSQETRREGELHFRKSPKQKFEETDSTATKPGVSTYPSGQAAIGWGLALLLSEISPEHQNSILEKGFEYGHTGVVEGDYYASDALAGRIMASFLYTQAHNNPDFRRLLEKAKAEYSKIKTQE